MLKWKWRMNDMDFRNLIEARDICDKLLDYIHAMNSYKLSLEAEISQCERRLLDLDHILRDNPLSVAEISKLVQLRKSILEERLKYKDELSLIEKIPNNQWNDMFSSVKGFKCVCDQQMPKEKRMYTFISDVGYSGKLPYKITCKLAKSGRYNLEKLGVEEIVEMKI